MQATTRSSRKNESIAVARSYQPTRIERELLAHVFELACYGHREGTLSGHDRMNQVAAPRDLATPDPNDSGNAQDGEVERAT